MVSSERIVSAIDLLIISLGLAFVEHFDVMLRIANSRFCWSKSGVVRTII